MGLQAEELTSEKRALLNELLSEEVKRAAAGSMKVHEVFSAADFDSLAVKPAVTASCDDTSCAREIAGALDATFLLSARAGKLGTDIAVTLKLIDIDKGEVVRRSSGTLPAGEEERYPDLLRALVIGLGIAPRLVPPSVLDSARGAAAEGNGVTIMSTGGANDPSTQTVVVEPVPKNHVAGWLLLTASVLVLAGSIGFDGWASTSKNGSLDVVDFLPIAGYGGAVTLFVMGVSRL